MAEITYTHLSSTVPTIITRSPERIFWYRYIQAFVFFFQVNRKASARHGLTKSAVLVRWTVINDAASNWEFSISIRVSRAFPFFSAAAFLRRNWWWIGSAHLGNTPLPLFTHTEAFHPTPIPLSRSENRLIAKGCRPHYALFFYTLVVDAVTNFCLTIRNLQEVARFP